MNIYVGNLAWKAKSEDIAELFEQYGAVDSAKVITDRDTGRSKGFGFVEMPDQDEAHSAIQDLDGTEFMGRRLRVNEARERRSRANHY